MNYQALILKNRLENFFIFPFIILGYLIYLFTRKKWSYTTYFFFPFYHTGGAEKVHLQITEAVGNNHCLILFTRKSTGTTFYKGFKNTNCNITDISRYTDNKYLYFLNLIYRGIVAAAINYQETKPVVFNGQSNFAYKISPWLKKGIVQIELIHALNTFSFIRIPFIRHYANCVTVSQEIIDKHAAAYRKKAVPEFLMKRFSFIETRIELPAEKPAKDYNASPLQLLYVGRGTPEKRVGIVANIAERLSKENFLVECNFVGDVGSAISLHLHKYCHFFGDIDNENDLNAIYHRCHILIVSSETESGPLVIMEAMARGLAIVTTEVGFVTKYLANDVNGLKVDPYLPAEIIVAKMASFIKEVYYNRNTLASMGRKNREIAYNHFGLEGFKASYKHLFESVKSKP